MNNQKTNDNKAQKIRNIERIIILRCIEKCK